MYIQVRSIDGKSKVTITASKTAKIKELKLRISEKLDVPIEKQRLFFRGKQLENDHSVFEYDIKLNDVVQLMIKQDLQVDTKDAPLKDQSNKDNVKESSVNGVSDNKIEDSVQLDDKKIEEDQYYKVGDIVDCRATSGGWFEAEVIEIIKTGSSSKSESNSYKVKFLNCDEEDAEVEFKNIRPRANKLLPLKEIKEGQVILANYNVDNPEEPGFWYTCLVTSVNLSRKPKLVVTVEIGRNDSVIQLQKCKIKFIDHLFRLEEPKLLTDRTKSDDEISQGASIPQRDLGTTFCDLCKDAPVERCSKCGCQKCHLKCDPDKTILCDECDDAYHIYCLDPPLQEVPADDDWYCPVCKNDDSEIVKAGEKLKFSKKKSQMASHSSTGKTRDWGKGMACVGRTTECTIVPPNHFGPIPGIEVGTTWKFRLQASEAGVHRPHVAGIHGRESEGAYSIALSGGYEDDVDNGETFLFTGSGGRDLSGNKRTAEQTTDQALTRMNLALARNCNAPVNTKEGAASKDWKKGKPVRVVRNYKMSKHSEYAPTEGNRYDGIYKVVKYYPEKGKSGFLVWRYLLHRDDPTPAPWTPEGEKFMAAHGLDTILIPDGYEEVEKAKKESATKKKRSLQSESPGPSETSRPPPKKKLKTIAYELPDNLRKMIADDTKNSKLWETVLAKLSAGKQEFLNEVQNTFVCICCLELVNKPVTTDCNHNFCKACLMRSFKSEVYNCAHCRHDLKDYEVVVNDALQEILCEIFPGYNSQR